MHKLSLHQTSDGSYTLALDGQNEQYHSTHGALQESMHVFIQSGLQKALLAHSELKILEVGWGTGLNSALTLKQIAENKTPTHYTALEPHLLSLEWVEKLQYNDLLEADFYAKLLEKHRGPIGSWMHLTPQFSFRKLELGLADYLNVPDRFNLIYYDAFGPRTQGDLWEKQCFEHLSTLAEKGCVFVTYCAKGSLKRDLKACGWEVESIPGPPGKREMVRATYLGE